MKRIIFYSWQSDLPNNTNRGFIESCINQAIKKLKSLEEFSIELNLDRDTKNEPGTPDIVNTIFSKIENSKVFIADISITNPDYHKKKTPNPNVLIELGYAAKVLGWERIICVFNEDYGDIADLPFDLKFRRPLVYSLKEKNKVRIRESTAKAICKSIIELNSKGLLNDELDEYLRVQVDTEILTIIDHLSRTLFGYENFDSSLKGVSKFLNLKNTEIKRILRKRDFLGFQVFKSWDVNEKKLDEIIDKTIASKHSKREITVPIINLKKWVGSFNKFNSSRTSPDLFIKTNKQSNEYKAINGPSINPKNIEFPDRYILIKKIDKETGIVQDFGDFTEKDKIEGLLNHCKINKKYLEIYSAKISEFINIVENWLDLTNGEFVIDNINMFELRTASNNEEEPILQL